MHRLQTERPETFRLNLLHPLARGLVFAGLGMGGKTFLYKDSSRDSGGNDGTLTGYTGAGNTPVDRWSRALGRACLTFNAVATNRVNCGTGLQLKPTGAATWALWSKYTGTGANTEYFFGDCGAGGHRGMFFEVVSSTQVALLVGTGADTYYSSNFTVGVPYIGIWTHWACVFRPGQGIYCYQNGILIGSKTTSPPAALYQNDLPFIWGNRGDLSIYWPGLQADPCIWSRALSPAEIGVLADPSNVMLGGLIRDPRPNRSFVGQVGSATYTSSGSAAVKKATASASGLYSLVVYTGSGSATATRPTGSASATYTTPVYTASGAPSCKKATASASATFTVPVYTGTGSPVVTKASASAAATYANITYTGDGSPTVTPIIGSAAGTFVPFAPSGAVSPSVITKHGTTTPTVVDLADFQLGYDSVAGKLYIRSGASIVLIGPP
jgi:hypothetical protein